MLVTSDVPANTPSPCAKVTGHVPDTDSVQVEHDLAVRKSFAAEVEASHEQILLLLRQVAEQQRFTNKYFGQLPASYRERLESLQTFHDSKLWHNATLGFANHTI